MSDILEKQAIFIPTEQHKQTATAWFQKLCDEICATFEAIEDELCEGKFSELPAGRFERKTWKRSEDPKNDMGGGEMSIMRGRVFEKVGVNISTVYGAFPEQFAKQIPGAENNPSFWASGISLVAHLRSPKIPAAHFNTRHIMTTKSWFGGGGDLTPMKPITEDTAEFHAAFKKACDAHDPSYYVRYKQWCDEYFFLKHRNEPRGVGGIFYDYLYNIDENSWLKNFTFTQDVGKTFRDIYPQIIRKHLHENWTDEDRQHQLEKRGRYVEFNLLYDRGTTFGLQTGGNVEAILMSLPPEVTWG